MWRVTGKLNFGGRSATLPDEPKEFEWEIPNFSCSSESRISFYHSPSFYFAATSWHVVLRPGIRYLSVYLYNETRRPIQVSCAFSIKDINGKLIGEQTHARFYTRMPLSGFLSFFSMSSLKERESYLIPSGNLTIVCKLELNYDVERTVKDINEANILGEKKSSITTEKMKFTGNDKLKTIYNCITYF